MKKNKQAKPWESIYIDKCSKIKINKKEDSKTKSVIDTG